MTKPGSRGSRGKPPQGRLPAERVDELASTLDGISRDLDDIEAVAAAALAGDDVDPGQRARVTDAGESMTYEQIVEHYAARRTQEGWGEPDLLALLPPEQRELLDSWRVADRLPWQPGDFGAVAVAGLLGVLGAVFDTSVDHQVLEGLKSLKDTDVMARWEAEAARLPVDYTGPFFGGPAHRVKSAGHDVGRLFTALDQVRTGTFRGVRWQDGVQVVQEVTTTRSGLPFKSAADPVEALVLLLKHWAADVVTPMSLPLPGWSLLYEMPDRELSNFARVAYAGNNRGDGLNLRTGVLTPALGILATEMVIRTHVHVTAYRDTDSSNLSAARRAKRAEMLLAAHGLAGAASLSKFVAAAIVQDPTTMRHLNIPLLMRTGQLAVAVHRDVRARRDAVAPTWEALWADEIAVCDLEEALRLADLLDRGRGELRREVVESP